MFRFRPDCPIASVLIADAVLLLVLHSGATHESGIARNTMGSPY